MSGTEDHTVPQVVTEDVHALSAEQPEAGLAELRIVEGRGHSLTIDAGWRDVAEVAIGWLAEHVPALGEESTAPRLV